MTQQHLRIMYSQVDQMATDMRKKLKEYDERLLKLEKYFNASIKKSDLWDVKKALDYIKAEK